MCSERKPTTQLTLPQVWHEYAKVLYVIPVQPAFPHPHGSCSYKSTFSTLENIGNAIVWLQFGKAQDHDGLVGELLIYAHDIFNRAM